MAFAAAAMPLMGKAQKAVPDEPIYPGANVGPAVSGSASVKMIPIEGIRFIVENYPKYGIVSMEKEFAPNTYDVKLTDGTEIEFNSKGNVIEIDAAEDQDIPESVIQAILPVKAYNKLKNDGIADNIESIEVVKGGYKIDVNIPDAEYFYAVEEDVFTPA